MIFQSYGFYNSHHSNIVCQHYIVTSPKQLHRKIRMLSTGNGMTLYKIGIGTPKVKRKRSENKFSNCKINETIV